VAQNEQKLAKHFFINLQRAGRPTVDKALYIVRPLRIYPLIQIHQHRVLRLELSVKYAFHVTVSTWLPYIVIDISV